MDTDSNQVSAEALSDVREPAPASRLRPWQVYVFALASFGLYLPYWTWRQAKRATSEDGNWATPYFWALGAMMPPVAWAILYDLGREAVAKREPGRWRVPAGLPAALTLIISILGIIGPLQTTVVGWLVLAPLPFAMVQGMLNGSSIETLPLSRRSGGLRVVAVVGTVVGIAAFVGSAYFLDGQALSRWGAATIAADSVVAGDSDAYELRIPNRGWKRLASGTFAEDGADLELGGPGQLTWVIVYVEDPREIDIDSTVSFRRQEVFATGTPAGYEEQRYFLDEDTFAPVSVVDYRVTFPLTPPDYYVVLTTRVNDALIEVIGYTGEPHRTEELRELVLSLRVPEDDGSDV